MNISIFYSSEDHEQLLDFEAHLRAVAEKSDDIWCDNAIPPGDSWPEAIFARLLKTNVAVFLVSNSFFKSRYIREVEGPMNVVRARLRLLAARLPILVRPTTEVDKTKEPNLTQLLFKRQGVLVPFSDLTNEEKRSKLQVEIEKARKVWEALNQKRITGRARRIDCGKISGLDLRAPNGRAEGARKLANDYRFCPDVCIRNAIKAYLKLRHDPCDGVKLAEAWGKRLSERFKRVHFDGDDHKAILTLLEKGPPKSPVHLENFAPGDLSLELLMKPGIARLLNGLRVMESNYEKAETLIKDWEHKNCALAFCALGQCYRKKDKLGPAETNLHKAKTLAERMQTVCSCGLSCPKHSILAEVRRGLGTVYRKMGHFEDARTQFELALSESEDSTVPLDQKAGVHYSFGYFLLEHGVSGWDGKEGGTARVTSVMKYGFNPGGGPSSLAELRLGEALKHFDEAHRLSPDSGPALSRRGIVRQMLGQEGFQNDFLYGRVSVSGPEAPLTKFFCEVALFLHKQSVGRPPDRFEMEKAGKELVAHYLGQKDVSEGPRQCHAFDLQLILRGRNLKQLHRDLDRAAGLLIKSATWERLHSINDQHAQTNAFLDKYNAGG